MPKPIYILKTMQDIKTYPDIKVTSLFVGELGVGWFQIGPTKERREFEFGFDPNKTTLLSARMRSTVTPDNVPLTSDYYTLYLNGSRISFIQWDLISGPVTKTAEAYVASTLVQGLNTLSVEVDRGGTFPVSFHISVELIIEYTGQAPNVEPTPGEVDWTKWAVTLSYVGLGIAGLAVVLKAWRRK